MNSVLIVESQAGYRQELVNLFNSQSDFVLLGATASLREAANVVARLYPDLVLLDYHLPDATGPDAAQTLLLLCPQAYIIFLADRDENGDLFAALRSGAKGYLLKGLLGPKLLASLRSISNGQAPLSRSMVTRLIEEFSRMNEIASPDGAALGLLTLRELDVLSELTKGGTNREIANRLFISEYTVKNHLHNILEKLSVKNRQQAAQFARKNGLFT